MIYHTTEYVGDSSTFGTFRDLKTAVKQAVETCERFRDRFDVIAVQGTSGMCLGFPLALALDVDIVVVRKPGEDAHTPGGEITGVSVKDKRCLFVDDFISMGTTRARVGEAVLADGGKITAEYTSRENSFIVR